MGENPTWWRDAVVYEIYPRAFADHDGDGIGDLLGVADRAHYLAELGIDAVWLTPFYPSALADGGYDVDDYRDVDPRLGTLEDFDQMVTTLGDHGIRVLVDIVPNHTSNRHPWFVEALAARPRSPARNRYLFRDGTGAEGEFPPNDWQSLFGGSAWEPVGDGQWYFHHFAMEQPDLNWHNDEVRADFAATLRFWADRGVSGFRVDAAHGLIKDLTEPYVPWSDIADWFAVGGEHPLWDRDEVHEVYASWRKVFDDYEPPLFGVAEANVPDPVRRARYASPTGLGQTFNFDMMDADWSAGDFKRAVDSVLDETQQSRSSPTWLLGCHDTPRAASRFGLPTVPGSQSYEVARTWLLTDGTSPPMDRDLGERRARAALMFLLALPGSSYIYQGDELGLHEVADLPREALADPIAYRSGGREKGRDGCRVPIPWTPTGPSYGFGPSSPRVPQPRWFSDYAVARQETDPASTLALFRRAVTLRNSIPRTDDFIWVETNEPHVVHFRRAQGWQCLTNFGPGPARIPEGTLMLSSAPITDRELAGNTTVWLREG